MLLASELVGNAVRYGAAPIVLRVRHRNADIRGRHVTQWTSVRQVGGRRQEAEMAGFDPMRSGMHGRSWTALADPSSSSSRSCRDSRTPASGRSGVRPRGEPAVRGSAARLAGFCGAPLCREEVRRAGQGHRDAEPSAYEPRSQPGPVAGGSSRKSLAEPRRGHADPDASTCSLAVTPARDVTGAGSCTARPRPRTACPRAGGARRACDGHVLGAGGPRPDGGGR